MDGVIALEA